MRLGEATGDYNCKKASSFSNIQSSGSLETVLHLDFTYIVTTLIGPDLVTVNQVINTPLLTLTKDELRLGNFLSSV